MFAKNPCQKITNFCVLHEYSYKLLKQHNYRLFHYSNQIYNSQLNIAN